MITNNVRNSSSYVFMVIRTLTLWCNGKSKYVNCLVLAWTGSDSNASPELQLDLRISRPRSPMSSSSEAQIVITDVPRLSLVNMIFREAPVIALVPQFLTGSFLHHFSLTAPMSVFIIVQSLVKLINWHTHELFLRDFLLENSEKWRNSVGS